MAAALPTTSALLQRTLLLVGLLLAPGARRDLDVGIPPGSALDWGQQFPGVSPPRVSYLSSTGDARSLAKEQQERSRSVGPMLDARRFKAAHSTPILSILTWDIPQHLLWIDNSTAQEQGPTSVTRASARPRPPRYGESMYWTTLAPLFRMLLHPRLLSRSEVIAHMLELGDATLPALRAASNEPQIQELCIEVMGRLEPRSLADIDCAALPRSARNEMLLSFAQGELLQHEPYDVTAPFAARLYLLSELFYPVIAELAARAPSIEVRRNAVSALARYDSRAARQRLLRIAERSQDQVVLCRALAGLGRFGQEGTRLDWSLLLERLQTTQDPVLRSAMIGALGRGTASAAVPYLLESLGQATLEHDSDQLQAILLALFSLVDNRTSEAMGESIELLLSELQRNRKSFQVLLKTNAVTADVPDPLGARAETIEQLATLLKSRLEKDADKSAALFYSLVGGREQMKSYLGAGFPKLLSRIKPAAQIRFLSGLASLRDEAGLGFLLSLAANQSSKLQLMARDAELASSYGAIALSLLPIAEQEAIARSLIDDARPEIRLNAFEILLALGDSSLETNCAALLTKLKEADLESESAATKTLYHKAIGELSRRALLKPSDALAWQKHLKGPALEGLELELPEAVTEQVHKIVQLAAGGAQKAQLKVGIEALLDVLPEDVLSRLLAVHTSAEVSSKVMQFLGGAKAHSADTPYLLAIEEEIKAYVFMREVRAQQQLGQGNSFEPPVNLKQTLLLAMGAMQHPMITELINNALNSEQEAVRARACIAMGMTQDARAARRLLPSLESKDAFTRLCAAQALESLLGELPFVDWIRASPSASAAGALAIKEALEGPRKR